VILAALFGVNIGLQLVLAVRKRSWLNLIAAAFWTAAAVMQVLK
jgi:hypothetical protein